MPRVSVIVPVYQVKEELPSCLESLLRQSLDDIEVVCVDDGSSDGSAEVLAQYAREDARIKVLHQENSGVGTARNKGMGQASGDLIMFCDADDALVEDACERVSEAFSQDGCDVMVFGFAVEPPQLRHPSLVGKTSPRDAVLDGSPESVVALLFKEDARPFGARIALSRDFVEREGICWHPVLSLGDDQFFCFEVYARSRRTTLCSRALYRYRMREGSLTHAGQGSVPELLGKMGRHLSCERAVLSDARASGLLDICPERVLDWCLELLLHDGLRLPEGSRQGFWRRWEAAMSEELDLATLRVRLGFPARMCLDKVLGCARGGGAGPTGLDLGLYFVRKRGLTSALRRALWGLARRR